MQSPAAQVLAGSGLRRTGLTAMPVPSARLSGSPGRWPTPWLQTLIDTHVFAEKDQLARRSELGSHGHGDVHKTGEASRHSLKHLVVATTTARVLQCSAAHDVHERDELGRAQARTN